MIFMIDPTKEIDYFIAILSSQEEVIDDDIEDEIEENDE